MVSTSVSRLAMIVVGIPASIRTLHCSGANRSADRPKTLGLHPYISKHLQLITLADTQRIRSEPRLSGLHQSARRYHRSR